jgi:Flp pilus assembly protein TadD
MERVRIAMLATALVLITCAAFWGLLSSGFINFDDEDYVTANPHVLGGLSRESVAWAFTSTYSANWHPVTWISHMIDVQWFGLDAGKHHRTSVILHAGNVILLFLLLVRMTGAAWRSAFVAALFAVHPLHVESVAWIAERKDVLSTLFWLLTTLAWLRWIASPSAGRYTLVLVLFAAGLMSKPMLVTLPFTLLLLDYWPLERATLPPLWREKLPLFAMSAASCVVTFLGQRSGGAVQSLDAFPFGERFANAFLACASYLGKTVWPVALSVFYPYPHRVLPVLALLGALALLVSITVLALELARTAPYVLVGWLWFLGTLVPVIGFPLIGIFIAAAWGLADIALRTHAVPYVSAACVAAIIALTAVTRVQVGYWSNSVTLFTHALAVTSENWLAQSNLGGALLDQGQFEEGTAHVREALRIRPSYAEAHYNLGLALARSGRAAEAIEELDRTLELRPEYARAHNNLAGVLAGQGRYPEAIDHLEQALRLDPGNAEAHYNLAGLLLDARRVPEAIAHFEAAARLRPDDAEMRAALDRARDAARPPR